MQAGGQEMKDDQGGEQNRSGHLTLTSTLNPTEFPEVRVTCEGPMEWRAMEDLG